MKECIRLIPKTFNMHEKTPEGFYKQLNDEFKFTYDPCPLKSKKDGLKVRWGKRVFVNPPYGKAIRSWLEKGLNELNYKSDIIVFLLPAYTDVKWFHEIVLPCANEIRFIKGRLKFGKHKNSAPFGSMLVIFRY